MSTLGGTASAAATSTPNLLKVLLQQKHWQTHGTFCREWKKAARRIDPDLESAYPSAAQFYRWIGGKLKARPYPAACKILEGMFTGYTVDDLFSSPCLADLPTSASMDVVARDATHSSADQATSPSKLPTQALVALRKTFSQVDSIEGQQTPFVSSFIDDLEDHVLTTAGYPFSGRANEALKRPTLTLIGGFAGCGKTEFGKFLSSMTCWALLDKDALTRPLTESLLSSLGGDPNDRHSELYRNTVRPLEYRCLMSTAFQNLDCGISAVVAAPFVAEFDDSSWIQRLVNRCTSSRTNLAVIWVDCDTDSVYEYLQRRSAARDSWKLSAWSEYLSSIDLGTRPRCNHFVVNNQMNTAVSLADQALAIAGQIS